MQRLVLSVALLLVAACGQAPSAEESADPAAETVAASPPPAMDPAATDPAAEMGIICPGDSRCDEIESAAPAATTP